MKASPVHDQLHSQFVEAQTAGYFRGRVDMLADVLTRLREVKQPGAQVKKLLAELEAIRYEQVK